jgi:hypothetical protein
VGAITSGCSD